MSQVETNVAELERELMAAESKAPGPPEAIGDRFKELIAKLMAALENIDPEEQAALIAAATKMIAAFGAGNFFGGFLAFLEFMRLYRKAIKPNVAPPA